MLSPFRLPHLSHSQSVPNHHSFHNQRQFSQSEPPHHMFLHQLLNAHMFPHRFNHSGHLFHHSSQNLLHHHTGARNTFHLIKANQATHKTITCPPTAAMTFWTNQSFRDNRQTITHQCWNQLHHHHCHQFNAQPPLTVPKSNTAHRRVPFPRLQSFWPRTKKHTVSHCLTAVTLIRVSLASAAAISTTLTHGQPAFWDNTTPQFWVSMMDHTNHQAMHNRADSLRDQAVDKANSVYQFREQKPRSKHLSGHHTRKG